MVYFSKGGFWLVLGQILLAVIGFSSAVVFANFLPPEEYGNFRYILSVASIIGSFSLSGLGVAVSGATARGNEGSLPYAFKTVLTWGWIMVLAGACAATYYFFKGNILLGTGMLLAGATSPFLIAGSLYDSFFEGKKIFSTRTLYSVVRNALPVCSVITAVLLTQNIYVILVTYFLSNTIVSALLHARAVKKHVENTTVEKDLVKNGMHVSFMNFLGIFATNMDRVLIFTMIGGAPLAIFSFAQAPLTYVQTGFQMIKSMMFPKFATRGIDEIKQNAGTKVLQLSVIAVLLTATYWVLAPFFFRIFFPNYIDSVELTQWFAFMLLATPFIVYSQTLLAHKHHKELHIVRVVTLVAKIAGLLVLIPLYGLMGVVWAALGTKVLESILVYYFFQTLKPEVTAT
jgi:O-antigen/teichoic acid export membrane protein